VVTVTSTDILVVAAISNWGAYGLAAVLGMLTGRQESLVDEDTHWRVLDAVVRAGALDGVHVQPIVAEDGVPARTGQALIRMLHQMIYNGSREVKRGF